MDLSSYRGEFPVTEKLVYINHAGVAPTSLRVRDAVMHWFGQHITRGILEEEGWEETAERCRSRFAHLIGASPDEIAFVRNTSHGLGLVAEGLAWKPGDRVAVATEIEYPSNVYVWQHLRDRGVEVDAIAAQDGIVTPEAVEAAVTPQTRLVAVSSTQYATGAVTDLQTIGDFCKDRGLLFCVDGIQTVGAMGIDVKAIGAHFLSADSHKWLLGVPGIGALYVSKEIVDEVRPVLVGWKSTTDGWNFDRAFFDLLSDTRKFEEGSMPYALIAGFDAAIELLEEVGIPTVQDQISSLIEHLVRGLETFGAELSPPKQHRHHIVTFTIPNANTDELLNDLSELGIVLSKRRGRLRISPHFYNTEEEMDRVVTAVGRFLVRP